MRTPPKHRVLYHFLGPDYPPAQLFMPVGHEWTWGDPVNVAIIGQSPSTSRPFNRRYEVFGSRSGAMVNQLLDRWVGELGYTVLLTNVIGTPLAPKAKVPKALITQWQPILEHTMDLFSPRYTIAIGGISAKMLLGDKFHGVSEDHGTLFTRGTGQVMPTYHFATSFSDLTMRRVITRDLERFEAAMGGLEVSLPPAYELHSGSLEEALMAKLRASASVVLDIETTGLDPATSTLTFVGLRFGGMNHLVSSPDPDWVARLGRMLCANQVFVVGHNLYFDLYFLTALYGKEWSRVVVGGDTMLMALVDGEPTLSLKHLTATHTDLNGSHSFGGPEDPAYLAMDLLSTSVLYDRFAPGVSDKAVVPLLHEMVPYLVEARDAGVRIDVSRLEAIGHELDGQLAALSDRLRAVVGSDSFNPGSDLQVSAWLSEQGVSTGTKTATGRMSVSSDALGKSLEGIMADDTRAFVLDLIEYRALKKIASGFVDNYTRLMDSNGFLHPRMLLHGARTGRLSSSDPNVQQVPRSGSVKTLFVSRWEGGNYGLIDLSQAELRVAALLSGDEELLQSLLQADPHRHNASRLYGKPPEQVTAVERKKSKAITFGVLYGGSPEGLASRTTFHVEEVREAQTLFSQAFPVLMQWLRGVEEKGMASLSITTLLGRTRELESVLSVEGERGARRKCANTHIQSLASDINLLIARSIIRSLRAQGLRSRFLFLVHDSIVLDIHPEETEVVAELVQQAYRSFPEGTPLTALPLWGRLPIIGELIVGPSWAAVESTNEQYAPLMTFPCSSS